MKIKIKYLQAPKQIFDNKNIYSATVSQSRSRNNDQSANKVS